MIDFNDNDNKDGCDGNHYGYDNDDYNTGSKDNNNNNRKQYTRI